MSNRLWKGAAAEALCAQTGLDDPSAAITLVASDLLADAGIVHPPLDIDALLRHLGFAPVIYCSMPQAGFLVSFGERPQIYVNEEHSPEKQRFTIAHEVTHTLLPTYKDGRVDDADTGEFTLDAGESNEEEYLCDAGAAALLMNPKWIQQHTAIVTITIRLLESLAKSYKVSLHAMARQLAAITEQPLAIVLWSGVSSGEPLRASSIYPSKTFPVESLVRRGTCLPAASLTARALGDNHGYSNRVYSPETLGLVSGQSLIVDSLYAPVAGQGRVISVITLQPPLTGPLETWQRFGRTPM